MSSPSPKKAKVHDTTSTFDGTNSASFNSDFGTGTSTVKKGAVDPLTGKPTQEIITDSFLNPTLKGASDTASTGLANNLSYLSMDPNQRVGFLTSGQDPLYNVLSDQNNKAFDQNMGRANINAARNGNQNSTALGGTLGQLMSNDQVTKNQILLQSLGYGNQTASQNAQTNLGALTGLAGLVYPLGSAANNTLTTAMNAQDRAIAATMAARNAAEQQYTNALNSTPSTMGKLLELNWQLGGAAAGAMMGNPGAGAAAGKQMGSSIAGAFGQGASSGNVGSVSPNYNFGGYLPKYNNSMSYYNNPSNYSIMGVS